MPKKKELKTIDELKKLAKRYGVEKNELLQELLVQYDLQMTTIKKMKEELEDSNTYTMVQEATKSKVSLMVNPILKELPKHCDSANRTAQSILTIITTLGKEQGKKSKIKGLI